MVLVTADSMNIPLGFELFPKVGGCQPHQYPEYYCNLCRIELSGGNYSAEGLLRTGLAAALGVDGKGRSFSSLWLP